MAFNLSNKTNQMQGNIINIALLKLELNWVLHEFINISSKHTILKPSQLKISNKMDPIKVSHGHRICSKHWPTSVPTLTSLTYYSPNYSYPLISDWPQLQTPLLTVHPIPVIIPNPTPILAQNVCPYSSLLKPMMSPIVPAYVPEELPIISYTTEQTVNCCVESYSEEIANLINNQVCYGSDVVVTEIEASNPGNELETIKLGSNEINRDDSIELYLSLPKDLFPPARTLTLDPNPIIDAFCKMTNIQQHAPWLLDLEFGIPKSPITRPIPIYNVKFNSIHCKNAPDAIHPSFEVCDSDFKRVLLFYYDCIVSAWYRGYVAMNYDRSVENFQSWLLLPTQVFGMCWP